MFMMMFNMMFMFINGKPQILYLVNPSHGLSKTSKLTNSGNVRLYQHLNECVILTALVYCHCLCWSLLYLLLLLEGSLLTWVKVKVALIALTMTLQWPNSTMLILYITNDDKHNHNFNRSSTEKKG